MQTGKNLYYARYTIPYDILSTYENKTLSNIFIM